VPDSAERIGDFQAYDVPLWDYASCSAASAVCARFPGNRIPPSRLSPFWLQATQALPVPNDIPDKGNDLNWPFQSSGPFAGSHFCDRRIEQSRSLEIRRLRSGRLWSVRQTYIDVPAVYRRQVSRQDRLTFYGDASLKTHFGDNGPRETSSLHRRSMLGNGPEHLACFSHRDQHSELNLRIRSEDLPGQLVAYRTEPSAPRSLLPIGAKVPGLQIPPD
jgi:hypothetical protein